MEGFAIIGVPIDSVNRGGGCELAPQALRELGVVAALAADDRGDLDVRVRGDERDPETGILASPDVMETTTAVRAAVAAEIEGGATPFLLGGCCAELPGALGGARDAAGRVGLVHVDGHLDLYDGVTSATGEGADMPVSVALGRGPDRWVEVAGGPSTTSERTAIVGYRDREESLRYGMAQPEEIDPPPALHAVEALRAPGGGDTGATLAARQERAGPFWLHLDVDVLDQGVFPATDYLMPGGMTWEELEATLTPLLASPALIGASLACYNPDKDPGRSCGTALVERLASIVGR